MTRTRRWPILVKLLVFFTVPTMLLFVGFAFVAHEVARRNLDAELGTRLAAVASSAATQIRGKYLEPLGPGDEDDEFIAGAKKKLDAFREATGVARIYIFDRDYGSRVDTERDLAIGTRYFQAELNAAQVESVFRDGQAASSVLFAGNDGTEYKAGYAPIRANPGKDDTVVLAIGVDAPAAFFDRLSALRRSLFLSGAILMLLVIAAAVFVAARISRPVRELARAAERIGQGDLKEPIAPMSRDEIGLLAVTMEEMRSELDARDERMQLMLSGIAHEVRNPLGGIELFGGILRDELPEGDERRDHVMRIEREVGYLKEVVENFLEYARRSPPALLTVELEDVFRDVCELERGEAADATIELTFDAADLAVKADAGQLRRVLLNLVRNAVQAAASSPPGKVALTAEVKNDRVWIAVENSGPPIDDEVRDRLFEPFFTTREKGTGLGLAFVREIVTDHGGELRVESGPEQPTRFSISLTRVPVSG